MFTNTNASVNDKEILASKKYYTLTQSMVLTAITAW